MLQGYCLITVTHKETTLDQIGKFVLPASNADQVSRRLHALKKEFGFAEMMYLSTCNRVFYLFYDEQKTKDCTIKSFLQAVNPAMGAAEEKLVKVLHGEEVVSHLMKVAASIDSLVIGEREILRQLREAYDYCKTEGLAGDYIRVLMQSAVTAAKKVYANTRIGEKPISVVSLAVQEMLKTKLRPTDRILMIGAGQTNKLFAKFLAKHGFKKVVVFNRTLTKAQELAEMTGGEARPLSEIADYQQGFDCLVVCTGKTEPVVTESLYKSLLAGETGEKIVIDLSIPYNVAPEVVARYAVNYIEINGLRYLAEENLAFRRQEVEQAQAMLAEHVQGFYGQFQQRQIERAMQRVPQEIKAVKQHAIDQVFKKEVESLDQESRALLEKMLTYMEKKCIGIPMRVARELVG